MLQQERLARHYLVSPPLTSSDRPSAGVEAFGRRFGAARIGTPGVKATCHPEAAVHGTPFTQFEAGCPAAATTMADIASHDVIPVAEGAGCSIRTCSRAPHGGSSAHCTPRRIGTGRSEASMVLSDKGDHRGAQDRQQREELTGAWCHAVRPYVHPRRATLRWFHGTLDEPLEAAGACAEDMWATSVVPTADRATASFSKERPSSRALPWGGRGMSETAEACSAPPPAAIPGYTGHVGGRGDGTFALGLSTTRTRGVVRERQRGFRQLFIGWGSNAPFDAKGGKYSEVPRRGLP